MCEGPEQISCGYHSLFTVNSYFVTYWKSLIQMILDNLPLLQTLMLIYVKKVGKIMCWRKMSNIVSLCDSYLVNTEWIGEKMLWYIFSGHEFWVRRLYILLQSFSVLGTRSFCLILLFGFIGQVLENPGASFTKTAVVVYFNKWVVLHFP